MVTARPPETKVVAVVRGMPSNWGVGMDEVRYAVRVRGRRDDAVAVALQEGLEVADDPVRTVLRGPLPDQSALLGLLRKARLLGLELVEVRRLPREVA
jgi:hypothetical protein